MNINNINKIKNNFGFTLIELLIVMTIISLLAGLSLFAIGGARESARDARRKADLEAIATALEIYKADCHQYPPTLTDPIADNCTGPDITYMQETPEDPVTDSSYAYTRTSDVTYELCAHLEDSSLIVPCTAACDPSPCRYRIRNP